ncbi:Hypothetical_protein [Hexamita inflata]|uniref:Hypothetical_protein n=1 Tax=Hexamita inflata TaxID=28002 RepID=A0AA86U3H7_9EUKA|nr:Hypothetical protein HINF_LOCUS26849 [Hexamita inflata]
MSIQLQYKGETKQVELDEQDTIMKSLKVAATKAFSIYIEDFEFQVRGQVVEDPEQFDPENDIFEIQPKSEALDLKKTFQTVAGEVGGYINKCKAAMQQPEFKGEFQILAKEVGSVLKDCALAALKVALDEKPEDVIALVNQGIYMVTGEENKLPADKIASILKDFQKIMQ